WGPREIGDQGAPVSLPKLKKAYEKGTRGISWGPLLTPGPRAVSKWSVRPCINDLEKRPTKGGLTTHGAPGQ
ncbi:unnamed protein product, partial [Staurois parvus]